MENNPNTNTIYAVVDLAAWVVEDSVTCGACAFWSRWADKITVTQFGSCAMAKSQAQGHPPFYPAGAGSNGAASAGTDFCNPFSDGRGPRPVRKTSGRGDCETSGKADSLHLARCVKRYSCQRGVGGSKKGGRRWIWN